jgi:NADH:ubiquinone oxidoreductase subunit 5 (subunit L)/multisubunit Na+/H+ antiporter MnhA subunit
MDLSQTLPVLLGIAWLLPLASFVLIVFFGARMGPHGRLAGHLATGAILGAFLLSIVALGGWLAYYPLGEAHHDEVATAESAGTENGDEAAHHAEEKVAYSDDWYSLVRIGTLNIGISYYIDALTVAMFAMVTLIATCIHFYSWGYMHDELHDITDHEITLPGGHHLHRHGRYHRFFQYLSLFCFSMLGLVYAGNVAMVFVFWELVGICSYFLIGFYYERKSASTAANKAFIVNRVGDFGMLIGMMALWGSLGTFSFGDYIDADGRPAPGIFSLVRPAESDHHLTVPDGMVRAAAADEVAAIARYEAGRPDDAATEIRSHINEWRADGLGYTLLVIAGIGIFCGCVGKSAQFPLHVWLPDAMEGPTPVSALVHSATMVAAGVYLVGRFFPVFTPEVLLVIAYTGMITLFIAATIALTAVDIKRVLAYSTVSQLGYMMLALGVGGWLAGIFHLITHAFFKSLLFMCSGSVIHACHTNDMTKMGGLLRKMPWTAWTMLVGCLAIIGAGIPLTPIGLSGYFSKDAIIAQALLFSEYNPQHAILFWTAAGGAALTAFYMFRLWFMTFIGPPRDHHIHDHAHESPPVMYVPLVVLAVFAVVVAWPIFGLTGLLEQARSPGTLPDAPGVLSWSPTVPSEHLPHTEDYHWVHTTAGLVAFGTATLGVLIAAVFYAWRVLDAGRLAGAVRPLYRFLVNKWWFDELYHALIVAPAMFISRRVADFDRAVIDRFVDGCARAARGVATFDDVIDRYAVDGAVNTTARWIYATGDALRQVQTGKLRQYVTFIVVGTVAIFVIISFLLRGYSVAGN